METIKKIKVKNMLGPSFEKQVPNQFEITTPEGVYLQSYQTLIAFRSNDGKVYLDREKHDYSNTTIRYRNRFLGMTSAGVKKAIKEGRIILTNLDW